VWEGGLSAEHVERRHAAVLAADVVGYSRLMGEDADGAIGTVAVADRGKGIVNHVMHPTI
jgi:class 3 adenylate cyclase